MKRGCRGWVGWIFVALNKSSVPKTLKLSRVFILRQTLFLSFIVQMKWRTVLLLKQGYIIAMKCINLDCMYALYLVETIHGSWLPNPMVRLLASFIFIRHGPLKINKLPLWFCDFINLVLLHCSLFVVNSNYANYSREIL